MMTAQVETLEHGLDELKPILPLHWAELGLNRDEIPLDPQYEVYLQRERNGEVLYVTVRKDGDLIGYFVGFIAPGLHYQTCLTLIMDIFYIHPDHRGAACGILLFDMVRLEARRRGVRRWFVGHKEHSKIHPAKLFAHYGFEQVETFYSLMLEG